MLLLKQRNNSILCIVLNHFLVNWCHLSPRKVVAAIIEGDNVISITREIIGKTNPKEASTGTIRGDFGIGILENSIHASDSKESFDKEVNVIF